MLPQAQIDPALAYIFLSVYSKPLLKHDQLVFKADSMTLLKKVAVNVSNGFFLLLNHDTRKTKIVTSQQNCDRVLMDHQFSLLTKIFIHQGENERGLFDIEGFYEDKRCSRIKSQIYKGVFLSLASSEGSPTSSREFLLGDNDVVQFGREAFRVKIHSDEEPYESSSETVSMDKKIYQKEGESLSGVCRVCLESAGEEDLISPCSCTGSCGYIHFTCLQQWIAIKIIKFHTSKIRSYTLGAFCCEICKTEIPNHIVLSGKVHNLIPKGIWSQANLTLEQIYEEKEGRKTRPMIHCIHLEEDGQLNIGRSNINDLALDFSSVSRFHAQVTKKGGQFYLKDLGSKYGTFLSLRQKVEKSRFATLIADQLVYVIQTPCK